MTHPIRQTTAHRASSFGRPVHEGHEPSAASKRKGIRPKSGSSSGPKNHTAASRGTRTLVTRHSAADAPRALTGGHIERPSTSAQLGAQSELRAAVARAEISATLDVEVRALEAGVHVGTRNADGSKGINVGASFRALTVESTLSASGNSVTAGLSASVGGEFSLGTRDADQDNHPEYCARVGVGSFVAGVCVEPESLLEAASSLRSGVGSLLSQLMD